MGECGCSAEAVGKLPLDEKTSLIVEVYPGCEYCGADWALSLLRVANDDPDVTFFYDDVPAITFDKMGYWHRKILDADKLRESFKAYADEPTDEYDPVNYAMGEFISRGDLRDAFPYNDPASVSARSGDGRLADEDELDDAPGSSDVQ